jgi:hypothetical protein
MKLFLHFIAFGFLSVFVKGDSINSFDALFFESVFYEGKTIKN